MPMKTSQAVTTHGAPRGAFAAGMRLRPLSTFAYPGGEFGDPAQRVADWVRTYLMRPHPDLGRDGAVCPYTPVSVRAGLAIVGSDEARDEEGIFAAMRQAITAFETMDCKPAQRSFRCVVVAFRNCDCDKGRAALKRVQNRLRPESTRKGKMIGLFEPHSEDRGLINPEFRPLRSPLPLLAIRSLVEGDAPFVVRNPRILPIYLLKFPFSGPRKLMSQLWR